MNGPNPTIPFPISTSCISIPTSLFYIFFTCGHCTSTTTLTYNIAELRPENLTCQGCSHVHSISGTPSESCTHCRLLVIQARLQCWSCDHLQRFWRPPEESVTSEVATKCEECGYGIDESWRLRWEAKSHEAAVARLGRKKIRLWCCVEVGVVDEPAVDGLDYTREEEKVRWNVKEMVEAYERQNNESQGLWEGLRRMRQAMGISHFRA